MQNQFPVVETTFPDTLARATDRYAMLDRIRQCTLVVHGNKDVVVTPINAFILAQHLPDARLVMYLDASHGAQSQHAGVFLEHARMFLNR
jgi:pimeloyl-ACP methyl ester carboxylesterase